MGGVSLGFKHHFGSIPDPGSLHDYIDVVHHSVDYNSSQNPMVDIYKNTHIRDKTRLIVGDGLFGCLGGENQVPTRWSTFGNQGPNSLLFATDPVAIDCVMYDLLDAEKPARLSGISADDYLRIAQTAGLGIFERWSSRGVYNRIDYTLIEL
jgi:hypothetical protein